MSLPKIKAPGAADSMKEDDGNESLDTYIRQAIGREPFLSFSRANDSSVQWFQLLHALDQQADLPGWPLLSPSKVQMQKCDKCSFELCSTINYRRHMRSHRRNLNLDKDSTTINRVLLRSFWDKLCQEEAMKIMSFDDVSLEGATGSSILKALSSFLRKPGFSFPQRYVRSGSALLDIVQGKPSRFPISSEELFSILDDASEKTFLMAGTAVSLLKYVFEGEAAKIGLEMRNLVACTSFLVEQKLVRAWLANKEAEALRHQKLLVEEEEAAQKRQAALSEKKRQKKLRQKEQRAKEQVSAETDDTAEDGTSSPPESTHAETPDSIIEVPKVPQNTAVSSEPVQIKNVDEDKSHGKDTPQDSLPSPPTSSRVDTPDSILEVAEISHDTTLSSEPAQIKRVEDLNKSHENDTSEDSPHPPPISSPVGTPPESILEGPEVPHNTALSYESVRIKHVEDLDKSLENEDPEDSPPSPQTSSPINTPDSVLQVSEVLQNTTLSSEPVQIKRLEDLDKSREIKDPYCDTSLNVDPDLGAHQTIEHGTLHRGTRRRKFKSHSQAPKLQRTPNPFQSSQNQATKLRTTQKHGSSRDSQIAVTNINKVWTPKQKLGTDQESTLHEQDKKHVLIGSIPVKLRKRSIVQQNERHLGKALESSALELSIPDVDGNHERPVKTETFQDTANPSTVKLRRPVSRHDNGGQLPIQNDRGACEIGSIPCNDSDQAQQTCEEIHVSADSLLQQGSRFSSDEAEAFLKKRWEEAIESNHVKLTLFSEDSQPGCSEVVGLNQETTSSKKEKHGILGSEKSHSESYTNLEHLTTVKSKARAKAEKGSKVKYVPKKSGY